MANTSLSTCCQVNRCRDTSTVSEEKRLYLSNDGEIGEFVRWEGGTEIKHVWYLSYL